MGLDWEFYLEQSSGVTKVPTWWSGDIGDRSEQASVSEKFPSSWGSLSAFSLIHFSVTLQPFPTSEMHPAAGGLGDWFRLEATDSSAGPAEPKTKSCLRVSPKYLPTNVNQESRWNVRRVFLDWEIYSFKIMYYNYVFSTWASRTEKPQDVSTTCIRYWEEKVQ